MKKHFVMILVLAMCLTLTGCLSAAEDKVAVDERVADELQETEMVEKQMEQESGEVKIHKATDLSGDFYNRHSVVPGAQFSIRSVD